MCYSLVRNKLYFNDFKKFPDIPLHYQTPKKTLHLIKTILSLI